MVGLVMVYGLLAVLNLGQCLESPVGDRKEALAVMEANLLKVLGMSKRPRPRSTGPPPRIPPAMIQLYKDQTGLDIEPTLSLPVRHPRAANTARSFVHTETSVDLRFKRENKFRLNFNVSSLPRSEKVTAAELRLWLPKGQGGRQRVLVHDIVRPGVKGKSMPVIRLIDTREVDPQLDDGVTMDVQPAVERWSDEPDHNHGLIVEVKSHDGSNVTVRLRRSAEEPDTDPTLVVFTDDGRLQESTLDGMLDRRKRATQNKHHRRKERQACRRHPLYVNFEEVGWSNWIVAPPGYNAYYCLGDCPFPLAAHLNSTNHAVIQTFVNSMNPSAVPKACCVPTKLSPMSMLFVDESDGSPEGKVVLKVYQEMVVESCGCW